MLEMGDPSKVTPSTSHPELVKDRSEGKQDNMSNALKGSTSDTTIYKNVLQKVPLEVDNQAFIEPPAQYCPSEDPEITFKDQPGMGRNKQQISSSSEEQVDTSDEFANIEEMDINDRFIADCAREAEIRKRDNKAAEMIKLAEASKARLIATPGNHLCDFNPQYDLTVMQHSSLVDEKYIIIGAHVDVSL